jgi:hypothetical protein
MLRHRPDRRRSAPVVGSAAQHESWRKDGLEEIKDPLARTLKRAPILRSINTQDLSRDQIIKSKEDLGLRYAKHVSQ